MELNLKRPIIFFDLETTGTDVTRDRIVEISLIKVNPDGTEIERKRRINPERHIPAEATAVHHITDDDVKDEPTFRQLARSLADMFEGADIAGFNSNRFDVPVLCEEFARAGVEFNLADRRFVDVQTIFHKQEPRTLVAAYKFYCGKNLEDAHSADADTRATYEVLKAQLDRYADLRPDVEFLSDYTGSRTQVDLMGRMKREQRKGPDGETREVIVFNFGKHKGRPVEDVLRDEPSYFNWIMNGEFAANTKEELKAIYLRMDPDKARRAIDNIRKQQARQQAESNPTGSGC